MRVWSAESSSASAQMEIRAVDVYRREDWRRGGNGSGVDVLEDGGILGRVSQAGGEMLIIKGSIFRMKGGLHLIKGWLGFMYYGSNLLIS